MKFQNCMAQSCIGSGQNTKSNLETNHAFQAERMLIGEMWRIQKQYRIHAMTSWICCYQPHFQQHNCNFLYRFARCWQYAAHFAMCIPSWLDFLRCSNDHFGVFGVYSLSTAFRVLEIHRPHKKGSLMFQLAHSMYIVEN